MAFLSDFRRLCRLPRIIYLKQLRDLCSDAVLWQQNAGLQLRPYQLHRSNPFIFHSQHPVLQPHRPPPLTTGGLLQCRGDIDSSFSIHPALLPAMSRHHAPHEVSRRSPLRATVAVSIAVHTAAAAAAAAAVAAAAATAASTAAAAFKNDTTDFRLETATEILWEPFMESVSGALGTDSYKRWYLQNQEPALAAVRTTSIEDRRKSVPPKSGADTMVAGQTLPRTNPNPIASSTGSRTPSEEGSSYAVYDSRGSPSTFNALLASLESYDVVLLGEYHDDPVAHKLQLQLLRHVLQLTPSGVGASPGADQKPAEAGGSGLGTDNLRRPVFPAVSERRPVALSLEMFERDVQDVMNEYLAGTATEADLVKDARPWPNYASDYRPLVLAAKEAGAPVVCANAPRRYVGLVGRSGSGALSSLPPSSLRHLPPLPLKPASDMYVAKIRWTMQRARDGPSEHADAEDGGKGKEEEEEEEAAAPLARPTRAVAAAVAGPLRNDGGERSAGSNTVSAPATASSAAAAADSTTTTPGAKGQSSATGGDCPHIGLSLRSNFVEAQNLWDAAMADSIARALKDLRAAAAERRRGLTAGEGEDSASLGWGSSSVITAQAVHRAGATAGRWEAEPLPMRETRGASGMRPLVVHVCGKFHSEQRLGICEHLAAADPTASVCIITFVPSGRGVTVPSSTLTAAGLHTYGDWLVLTDGKLPRSFESDHPL